MGLLTLEPSTTYEWSQGTSWKLDGERLTSGEGPWMIGSQNLYTEHDVDVSAAGAFIDVDVMVPVGRTLRCVDETWNNYPVVTVVNSSTLFVAGTYSFGDGAGVQTGMSSFIHILEGGVLRTNPDSVQGIFGVEWSPDELSLVVDGVLDVGFLGMALHNFDFIVGRTGVCSFRGIDGRTPRGGITDIQGKVTITQDPNDFPMVHGFPFSVNDNCKVARLDSLLINGKPLFNMQNAYGLPTNDMIGA